MSKSKTSGTPVEVGVENHARETEVS